MRLYPLGYGILELIGDGEQFLAGLMTDNCEMPGPCEFVIGRLMCGIDKLRGCLSGRAYL